MGSGMCECESDMDECMSVWSDMCECESGECVWGVVCVSARVI